MTCPTGYYKKTLIEAHEHQLQEDQNYFIGGYEVLYDRQPTC